MSGTPGPDLPARWAQRIERQESRGLTIARFRQREGVSRVSFHAWRRRPRGPVWPANRAVPPAFPRVRWSSAGAISTPSARVELDLPNGTHMRILDASAEFVGLVDFARGGGSC